MVTTNSNLTEEVVRLFEQAAEAAERLVAETDASRQELVDLAHALVRLAVRSVTPVIKYMDHPITIRKGLVRGVCFDVRIWGPTGGYGTLFVTRDGKIGYGSYDDIGLKELDDFRMFSAPGRGEHQEDDLALQALDILEQLASVFARAIDKIAERQANLMSRRDQLQAAVAAFKTND